MQRSEAGERNSEKGAEEMELNKNISGASGLGQLSNEITYRRYVMNKVNVKKFFREMTISEYIVLCMANVQDQDEGEDTSRVYLAEITEKLQIPVRQASAIVRNMRDRGLLLWSHDGNGSDGTYITITDLGKEKAAQQENVLIDYYGKVISKYGRENFVRVLHMMDELESVMSEQILQTEPEPESEESEDE